MSIDPARPEKGRTVLELGALVIAVEALLWGRSLVPRGDVLFGLLILLLIGIAHRERHDNARDIGLRADTAIAALSYVVPVFVIAAAVIFVVGAELQGARPKPSVAVAVQFIASGLAQQYLLLGFFYRRIQELGSSLAVGVLLTAAVFALLHIPNLFLTVVTFVAGVVCCVIYRRAPNLMVMGIVHGLIAYALHIGLPSHITGGMQVGIAYLHRQVG